MVNLIGNGSFVGHAAGWTWATGSIHEAVAFDPSVTAGATGGALAVSGGDAFGTIATYAPGGAAVLALGGLTVLDAVGVVRSDDPARVATWRLAFYSAASAGSEDFLSQVEVPASPPTLNAATFTQVAERDLAVPEGATHVKIDLKVTDGDAAEVTWWDDLYLGTPDGDAPPYAAAAEPAPLVNLLTNGDCEQSVHGWAANVGGETLTHETADPLAGAGSLAVETPGEGAEEGAYWDGPACVVVPEADYAFAALLRGTGTIAAWLYGQPTNLQVWDGTLSATPTAVALDVTIPAGVERVRPAFVTTGTEAADFVVDDISLGTPAEAADPARSVAVLRAMANRRRRE